MTIFLYDLFHNIDISETPINKNRINTLLSDLSEMLGQKNPKVPINQLPKLKESFRDYLKRADTNPSTIRNKIYRLNCLLEKAAQQGLIPQHKGVPLPPRPKKEGPDRRRYNALCLFNDWIRVNGISACDVTEETFRAYRNELKGKGTTCSEDQYNCAVKSWQSLAEQGSVPPLETPRWNDASKVDYGLQRRSWPAGFAADFDRFCYAATGQAKQNEKRLAVAHGR